MELLWKEKDIPLECLLEGKINRKIKGHAGKLMTVEVYFENGCISEPHSHIHEQMTYCLSGEFEFYIENQRYYITEGDTIYMPSNAIHNCKLLSLTGRLLDIFTPVREDFL